MGDLISRSALLKKIAEEYDLNYGEILINPERFYEMVETVPTAYDVEKVVAELEKESEWAITHGTDASFRKGRISGLNTAKRIANELAEEYINTLTGWISVKDKLPTEEGSYLVVGKTGGATVTRWYMPNKFHPQGHFGGNSAEYIRYWMPRPQAPKYEPKENKTLTNADRIRSMTDEELAEFFDKLETVCDMCACNIGCRNVASENCKAGFLKWLQSEVEGVTENE